MLSLARFRSNEPYYSSVCALVLFLFFSFSLIFDQISLTKTSLIRFPPSLLSLSDLDFRKRKKKTKINKLKLHDGLKISFLCFDLNVNENVDNYSLLNKSLTVELKIYEWVKDKDKWQLYGLSTIDNYNIVYVYQVNL